MSVVTESGLLLPDPRRFPVGGTHPLLDLALSPAGEDERVLIAAVRELLLFAADAEVRQALARAPDSATYARLWRAMCAASEGAGAPEEAIAAFVFAMPIVIVTGARRAAELPGELADPAALADVLAHAGALGASRNFGFSNALCSLETLERLGPATVLGWRDPAGTGQAPRTVNADPVPVRPGEAVHLRFLPGGAITPAAAPAVSETAAHMGAWGMPFARAIGAQLGAPGVEVLALPRPPAGVLRAAHAGRRAQLEVALNLFLSNTVRRFRSSVGDPSAVLSMHELPSGMGELRLSLSSPFDEGMLDGFRYPLHPLDDLQALEAEVADLLSACRVADVERISRVLPDDVGGAGARFLTPRTAAALFAGN